MMILETGLTFRRPKQLQVSFYSLSQSVHIGIVTWKCWDDISCEVLSYDVSEDEVDPLYAPLVSENDPVLGG